jgi:hypothetical protein
MGPFSSGGGIVGDVRADITAGAVFPDYELTDHSAKCRKLSELQGSDPLVVVLSGGDTAPETGGGRKFGEERSAG